MRGVVLFAYVLGVALPLLETIRRGFAHWLVNSTTMADDYIMGAVLLVAAISWSLGMRHAKLLLVIAWAYVLGVMNAPVWGHLEGHLRVVVICDNDPAEVGAIVVKGVIWLIALICLIVAGMSVRREAHRASPGAEPARA